MNKKDITVVICCAGMGTRLGIGSTKALVDVGGKPLIIRQLELLKDYDDVRIVVGYQAEQVIRVVKDYRKDIMFAFNYQFETTGVAASLTKGIVGARKYVVAIDGDLIVNAQDFASFMTYPGECLGGSMPNSDEPVYMKLNMNNQVVGFSKEAGNLEWMGIAKLETKRLIAARHHVFEMISPMLPIQAFSIRARDVDTPEDYEKMIDWFVNGCVD